MTSATTENPLPAAVRDLVDRCRVLSLPVWVLASNGVTELRPSGWGPADHWLQSPMLEQWIGDAVVAASADSMPAFIEVFPSCWIIPLSHTDATETRVTTVVMILGADLVVAEQFLALCDTARLDATMCRTALTPLIRHRREDVERLSQIVHWMHDDLRSCAESAASIESFTRQTSDTYEHISLLYQLGKAMHRLEDPRTYVSMACQLLYDTLTFDWVAVQLTKRRRSTGLNTETLEVAGHLPCPRRQFVAASRVLLAGLSNEDSTLILDQKTSELATLTGRSVLCQPIVSCGRMIGLLMAGNKRGSDMDISSVDIQLVAGSAEFMGSFIYTATAYHEQRTMFLGTIRAITSTIDAKDRYTRGHSDRVAHLGVQIAEAAGLDDATVLQVRLSGMLHDVGKIGVPESVLSKPGRLTEEEFEAVKRHPVIGYTILKDIEPLQDALPGVLYHHEQWDGNGYPAGLQGERIPLIARILAVADMFDAMSSVRAYQGAVARQEVLDEIARAAGTQLDPDLARIFLELDLTDYDRMITRHLVQDDKAA